MLPTGLCPHILCYTSDCESLVFNCERCRRPELGWYFFILVTLNFFRERYEMEHVFFFTCSSWFYINLVGTCRTSWRSGHIWPKRVQSKFIYIFLTCSAGLSSGLFFADVYIWLWLCSYLVSGRSWTSGASWRACKLWYSSEHLWPSHSGGAKTFYFNKIFAD